MRAFAGAQVWNVRITYTHLCFAIAKHVHRRSSGQRRRPATVSGGLVGTQSDIRCAHTAPENCKVSVRFISVNYAIL